MTQGRDYARELHNLLKDAPAGVPVQIPSDLAAAIDAEIRDRARPALEAIRHRERNTPRWLLDMAVD